MASWRLHLRQIDPPVAQVGYRTRGQRKIRYVVQLKAKVFSHLDHDALRQRATTMTYGIENAVGGRFDLGIVVAPFPHLRT